MAEQTENEKIQSKSIQGAMGYALRSLLIQGIGFVALLGILSVFIVVFVRYRKIKISGKTSSQFVSALLIIAPFAHKDTEIIVESLHSSPYVDITIDLMETFGVNVEKSDGLFIIKSHQRYKAKNYIVEGDFSSASYFIAANKITIAIIEIIGKAATPFL